MLIHRNLVMMIDINQSPVLCPHTNKTKQTNISIFSPIFGLTISFADPIWFAMYCDRGSQKNRDDKLDLSPLIK